MKFFASLITVVLLASAIEAGKISPSLHTRLLKGEVLDVMIQLPSLEDIFTDSSLLSIKDTSSRSDKMVNMLKERTEKSRKPFVNILSELGLASLRSIQDPIWISNRFEVQNADLALVEVLARVPGSFIIREPKTAKIIDPAQGRPVDIKQNDPPQWGVEKIMAPQAWNTTRGQGIIVGIIDTGVHMIHEALANSYAGAWSDPYYNEPQPTDLQSHGTHCIGSTLGRVNGVGVAPGAEWIACRGLNHQGSGTEQALLQCAQWMLNTANPKPHIVTNSWGGGSGDDWYNEAMRAWIVAGIVPVFALGNSGPSCGSANSPGDSLYCIAVGATTIGDGVASFSSRGPTRTQLKPEVSAPGQDVISCGNTGTSSYTSKSGTSMATPHVAGAIALLMAANRNLTYNDIRRILQEHGDHPPVTDADINCGSSGETWPNNAFGHSRINCQKAVAEALRMAEKIYF